MEFSKTTNLRRSKYGPVPKPKSEASQDYRTGAKYYLVPERVFAHLLIGSGAQPRELDRWQRVRNSDPIELRNEYGLVGVDDATVYTDKDLKHPVLERVAMMLRRNFPVKRRRVLVLTDWNDIPLQNRKQIFEEYPEA